MSKEKEKEKKKSQPINITGNKPAPDRSPNSTEEGKRQERAKQEQKLRAEKGEKEGKKESASTDPRRYYQGSEMQNKIEEVNRKISTSRDAGEKSKLQNEIDDLSKVEEEEKKEEEPLVASTTTTTKPPASTKTAGKF